MHSLTTRTLVGFTQLALALGVALFAPAWSFAYPEAWAYLAVFFGCTAVITVDLARRDPALLDRRVQAGPVAEQQRIQQVLQALAGLAFLAIFLVASLDHRVGWSRVPGLLVPIGDGLVALGFAVVSRVFHENTYTAATVGVADGQRVVATGPYGVVRHPMYAGALVLMVGTPLALSSWWAELPVLGLAAAITARLLAEERFLTASLPGYDDYRRRVRHRLVPFLW